MAKLLLRPSSFLFTQVANKRQFVLLFGPPGVGKGTFSNLLHSSLGLLHLSPISEIRSIIRGSNGSGLYPSLIDKLRSVIMMGGLVTNQLVLELIREKAELPQADKGILLEGFPNNEGQLKQFLGRFALKAVVNLELSEQVLMERARGRRVCFRCGLGYNLCGVHREGYEIAEKLPQADGKCDGCGGGLTVREDDSQRVFRARLKEYWSRVQPMLQLLQEKKLLLNFSARRECKGFDGVLKQLEQRLANEQK